MPWRETLLGRTVRVEPLTAAEHVDELWDAISEDPGGVRWTYRFQGPFSDKASFLAYLRRIEADPEVRFSVYRPIETGRAAGLGALMSIQPAAGSIEIGAIMMAPAMAGTTAATEALFLQIDWALGLGYRRMEWTCDPLNAASMRAAERLGFSYEARFRDAYVTKGRNRDKAVFSITDGAWPALRAAFRDWLEPENFAADGAQLSRLSDLTAPHLSAMAPEPPAPGQFDDHGQPLGADVPNWRPPPPPSRGTLDGRYVRLEPLTTDHAPALHAANLEDREGRIWDYLPYGPFAAIEDYTAWIAEMARHPDPLFFALVVEGEPLGIGSYLRIAPNAGSIELGHICLSPRLQKSTAVTEAWALMIGWAFDAGYRRFEWKCNAANAGSRRAALRLGLSYEGVFRQATVTKGRNRDTAWYAATRAEWPALKAAYSTWLSPENFGADGRQRQSLSALTQPILVKEG